MRGRCSACAEWCLPATVSQFGVSKTDFVPGSEAKKAWVSLSVRTCEAFAVAASAYAPEMHALVDALTTLQADPAVSALIDLRNVQYHRWGGESPGVTGVYLQGMTKRQLLEQGQVVGLSAEMLSPYARGETALDEIVKASRDALDAVVARLERFRDAWHAAFKKTFG